MSLLWSKVLSSTLLLPFNVILVGLLGLALTYSRWRRLGQGLIFLSLAALYIFATPQAAYHLLRAWEGTPEGLTLPTQAQAIVVLGGALYSGQADFPTGHSLSGASLERLRYGAYLHQKTSLPIVVSGDSGFRQGASGAEQMAWELEHLFNIRPDAIWKDPAAATTWENATYTYALLNGKGIRRILLVTNAWHMPRSQAAFEQVGFDVISAPTTWASPPEPTVRGWLPDAQALLLSNRVLHEWIGLYWYGWKYNKK